jgi:hypothetical protein
MVVKHIANASVLSVISFIIAGPVGFIVSLVSYLVAYAYKGVFLEVALGDKRSIKILVVFAVLYVLIMFALVKPYSDVSTIGEYDNIALFIYICLVPIVTIAGYLWVASVNRSK